MDNLLEARHYASAQEAFIAIIEAVSLSTGWVESTTDPTSIGSHFGKTHRKTKELICVGIAIDNPRARLIHCPPRRIDLAFAFANFIWTIGGNNDVSPISYYNPKGDVFSDDGKHFAGALGYRMQHTKHGSQLSSIVEILKNDPASRRAVIQFYSDGDSILRPRDTPCIIAMHLLIRGNKLVAIVHMRSQSALMVMPYDIVLYTMLHELVATELGIEIGAYFHLADSLHIYDDEMDLASVVLEKWKSAEPPPSMDIMPIGSLKFLDITCKVEQNIRRADSQGMDLEAAGLLPPYWRDIIGVLAFGRIGGKNIASINAHYQRWLQ